MVQLMKEDRDLMHLLMIVNYLAFREGDGMEINTLFICSCGMLQQHSHVDIKSYE